MKKGKQCKRELLKQVFVGALLCLLLCPVFGTPKAAMAEETTDETVAEVVETEGTEAGTAEPQWIEQEFWELETAGEFTVMFYYEGEQPEIIFISPTGVEYGEGISPETEFLSAHGDGWSTYKVLNAEAGQWRLRCDKKNNEEIEYTMVDVVNSICIQNFSLTGIQGTTATVCFEVTKGEESVWYDYTIYAVAKGAETVKQKLKTGSALAGEVTEIGVALDISSRAEYYLLLDVVHNDGELETFDSMETGPFAYENPNTPAAIADFTVEVNLESGLCEVDWSAFRSYGYVQYKLEVFADENTEEAVYNLTTEDTYASFFYPVNAENLEITLYEIRNDVLSKPKTKEIDLKHGEYVKVLTEEVTASATLELEYNVKEPTELYVILNDKSGVYAVDGRDTVLFTMQNGWNEVEAYFTGDDGSTYRVSKDIYYTWLAPTITLYEELDGKTIFTETVTISGGTQNAATLTVNGVGVELEENGVFSYELPLADGENTVTLVAATAEGISATRSFSVTKEAAQAVSGTVAGTPVTGGEEKTGAVGLEFVNLLPVIGCVVASLVLMLGFLLCSVNKKKGIAIALAIVFAAAAGTAGYFYYRLYTFNKSIGYTELAKNSVETAAKYLDYEVYMKWVSIGVAGLFAVTVLGIVIAELVKKLKKRKKKAFSDDEHNA